MFKAFYLRSIQEQKHLSLSFCEPWWFTEEMIKISEIKGQSSKRVHLFYIAPSISSPR